MYEQFFEMTHTPFTRDVPPEALYESPAMRDALGRLAYVADRQLFAPDPEVCIQPAEGEIHPSVSFGLKADAKVVLPWMPRPAGSGSTLLPGRCQASAPEGDRDRPRDPA